MRIDSRAVEGITILDLNGRITLGDDIAIFKNSIASLVAEGQKSVILNLRDVPYVDSSGIGELVAALTNLRRSGGELKLLNLSAKVRTLLEITRLYAMFDIKGNEAEAILAFSTKSAV
jgi:anti-sigma B factor antagonist